MKNFFHKKLQGVALIDVLLGLLILLATLPLAWSYLEMGFTARQQSTAAEQLTKVNKATGEYIKLHYSSLISSTTANTGTTLTIEDLKSEELLSATFNSKNVWGQEYEIYIRQPKPNELQGIVLTSKNIINDDKFVGATIPGTAAMLNGAGGYIPKGNIPGQSTDMLLGAYKAWSVNLLDYGITSPGAGHLGALTTFDSSALGQDFLYRVAVPGQDELNAMQTELDMTNHTIENVSDIQFVSHSIGDISCTEPEQAGKVFVDDKEGMYICRDNKAVVLADTGNSTLFKQAVLVSNNDIIDKPICPVGSGTQPRIFVAPSIVSVGAVTTSLASFQTWATELNPAQWQVHMRVLSKNEEWIYPSGDYGKIMVFTTCN